MSRTTVTPVETPQQAIRRLRNQIYNEQTRRENLEAELRRAVRKTDSQISELEKESRRREARHRKAILELQSDI